MTLRIVSTFIMLVSLSMPSSHAEIYSYKDDQGKLHFTDVPPTEVTNAVLIDTDTATKSIEKKVDKDLQTYLTNLIQPDNQIEKATLAVVKIETTTGSGSGFFVNKNGYIVTNKHVVRMTETKNWKSKKKKIDNVEETIDETKEYLQQKKLEMQKLKENLDDYKEKIVTAATADKEMMQQSYDYYLKRYYKQRESYKKLNADYLTAKKQLSKHKRNIRDSESTNTFKIIIKDKTELQAKLVKLSPNYDLALLKLIGNYETPFLKNSSGFNQGMDVYAIGSPLGFNDYVSKGVIMGIEKGNIVTDSQILPGNSGGPLITPDGDVVGINTAVYRAGGTLGSEVFGYAIPFSLAEKEFSKELN